MRRLVSPPALAALVLLVACGTACATPPSRLLFQVNPGEGFNLRRDALLRAALVVRHAGAPWTLSLPPIPPTPHWADGSTALPWSTFFDLDRLGTVVPVAEWQGGTIDDTWVLLKTPPPAEGGDLFAKSDCASDPEVAARHPRDGDGWSLPTLGTTPPARTRTLACLTAFAPFTRLADELRPIAGRTILVERFERLFWPPEIYDGPEYWEVRRAMVFAPRLRAEAARWREATFGKEPYLAVHLRRRDFLGTGRELPSLDDVVAQVRTALAAHGLQRVFLATDATPEEVGTLAQRLPIVRWTPAPGTHWHDGEAAIVDQILAADAAWFIGTEGSTFTTVIAEERELADRPSASTWNVLCPGRTAADGRRSFACEQPRPRHPTDQRGVARSGARNSR